MKVKFDNGDAIEIVSDKLRIVSGWASVEIKDVENHVVSAVDLVKAMVSYMVDGGILLYGHSNTPVGKIIYWDLRKNDETGKPGVYIVAHISSNNEIQDRVWELVKSGVLKGFSIGGYGKPQDEIIKSEDGRVEHVKKVTDIILKEISIVEAPANEKAVIEDYNEFAKQRKVFYPELDGYIHEIRLRKKLLEIEFGNSEDKLIAEYIARKVYDKSFDELTDCQKRSVVEGVIEFSKGSDIKTVIDKALESKSDLINILRSILEEAKKVAGYVAKHSDSGAYKGMAEDVVKTIQALIGDVSSGKVTVSKGVIVKARERDSCKEKYYDYDAGHFKGKKGERFDNCVKYQMECEGHDKKSAEAICAAIGRRAGKIK